MTVSTPETRSEQSAMWGTIVVILLIAIAILLIGYFAWWAPAHRETVIIKTPGPEHVTPVPVPQPTQPPSGGTSGQAPTQTAPAQSR